MRTRIHYLFAAILLSIVVTACSEDDPVAPQDDHKEAIGLSLYSSGVKVFTIMRGQTSDTLRATVGVSSDHYDVHFYDINEKEFEADDEHHQLGWEIADPNLLEVKQHAGEEGSFEFHLLGKAVGSTTIEFFILHEGHSDFRSGKIPVVVR